jgi:FkbM family methyltransferase
VSLIAKMSKLVAVSQRRRFRAALARHRVAAAIEHLDALRFCGAASLLDIGANKGQFALAFRETRPDGLIHAFEPLPDAADRFDALFAGDAQTRLHRLAVGSSERTATFHVTDRQDSSSLLKPGAGQRDAFGVTQAREIVVQVRPLETSVDLTALAHPVLMKIDVQGAELEVLRGTQHLELIDWIYVELSFVELYEGQPLFEDVRAYLADRGFGLRGVFNQAFTERYGPTQADCLFAREGM